MIDNFPSSSLANSLHLQKTRRGKSFSEKNWQIQLIKCDEQNSVAFQFVLRNQNKSLSIGPESDPRELPKASNPRVKFKGNLK